MKSLLGCIGCIDIFWCASVDCVYYNNGLGCSKCVKYGTCENCILKDTDYKPDSCDYARRNIMYGFPENYDDW